MDGGGKISHLSKFNDHIIACGNFVESTRFEFTKGILKLLQLLKPLNLVIFCPGKNDLGERSRRTKPF